MELRDITSLARRINENVQKVIVGRSDTVELVTIALLAGDTYCLRMFRAPERR